MHKKSSYILKLNKHAFTELLARTGKVSLDNQSSINGPPTL